MNTLARTTPPTPWYREPWPWLLMAGPAIVVVAGFVTLGMAINSADGLVADDYYKEGNAINMTMHRDVRARELGYHARVAMAGVRAQQAAREIEQARAVGELDEIAVGADDRAVPDDFEGVGVVVVPIACPS